jgi:hypothetical protein
MLAVTASRSAVALIRAGSAPAAAAIAAPVIRSAWCAATVAIAVRYAPAGVAAVMGCPSARVCFSSR